jgi:hypothetical protein
VLHAKAVAVAAKVTCVLCCRGSAVQHITSVIKQRTTLAAEQKSRNYLGSRPARPSGVRVSGKLPASQHTQACPKSPQL